GWLHSQRGSKIMFVNNFHFAGTGSEPDRDTGVAVVCVPEQKLDIVHADELDVQHVGGPQYWFTREDVGSVSSKESATRALEEFRNLLQKLPKQSLAESIRRLANRKQDCVHQLLMLKLAREISARLGVALQYIGSYTDACNAVVSGMRLLIRAACIDAQTGKAKIPLERHRFVNGQSFTFPFDSDEDAVDLFVVMLHRKISFLRAMKAVDVAYLCILQDALESQRIDKSLLTSKEAFSCRLRRPTMIRILKKTEASPRNFAHCSLYDNMFDSGSSAK
ncbi:unnamed protein product, partial [Amoebophrya sp. A25]